MATIDEVMETVREARHRGPEALAALALCYGADAVGWEIRHAVLRQELLDTERGMDEAREERDAAREALAAKDSAPDLDYPARAEVWRLRESVAALQDERDRAVQEREAFGLRASAAERERDEAQAERDALRSRPTYEARTVAPTIAEWRGHFRAGGSWIVPRPQWVPLVTILRGGEYAAAPPRSPEADAAWREAQAASDAAQMAARRMRGGR